LLAVEIVLIPGFGLTGIAGVGLLCVGCIMAWSEMGAIPGVLTIMGSIGISVLMVYFFPKTRTAKKMILSASHEGDTATVIEDKLADLIGKTGVAITPLRPAGIIEIDRDRYDVLAEGDFIEKGTTVVITGTSGNTIHVEVPETDSE